MLAGILCMPLAHAQLSIAFQGGEPSPDNNWEYTDTGANVEAMNQAILPLNYRSGTQSMVVGGTDPAGGSCFAGGTGNGAVIDNTFTFEEVDLSAYPGSPKVLEFWYGARRPYCTGSGWDEGENLLFRPIIDGVVLAPQTIVSGGGDISLAITENFFTYDVPACAESFGFILSIALNRRDELLFLDDVSLVASGNPEPVTVDAGDGGSICPGAIFELDGSISGSLSDVAWSGGTGTFDDPSNPQTGYTAAANESGTVLLSLSGSNICGSVVSDTVEVLIEGELPVASIVSSEGDSICEGQITLLTAFGGQDYVWSTGELGEDIFVSSPGNYSVTAGNICGSDTDSITLHLASEISVLLERYICEGGNVVLPDGTAVDTAGTYQSLINVAGGCDTLYTIEVLPAPALVAGPLEVNCDYDAGEYSLSLPIGGGLPGSYEVIGLNGSIFANTFTSAAIAAGSPYTFSVRDGNACETLVFAGTEACICPVSAVLSGGDSICAGGSVSLSLDLEGDGPFNLTYSDGNATFSVIAVGNNFNVNIIPAASAVFELLTVSTALCAGSASGSASIVVQALPNSGSPGTIQACSNDLAFDLIDVLGGQPDTDGVWTTLDGQMASGIFVPGTDNPGAYRYSVDRGVCGRSSTLVGVTIQEAPEASLEGTYRRCPGDAIDVEVDIVGGLPFTASLLRDGIFVETLVFNTPPFAFTANAAGIYTLADLTDARCNGAAAGSVTIEDIALPLADFDWESQGALQGNEVLLFSATEQGDGFSYSWQFVQLDDSGGPDRTLGGGTGANVNFSPRGVMGSLYRACLEVRDAEGCVNETCQEFELEPNQHFYVPNAFSPDGDGINDLFYPAMVGYDDYAFEFQIYDRLGGLVFESNDIKSRWNGSVAGSAYYAEAGIYLWRVALLPPDNARVEVYSGHVTLLR